MIPKIKYNIVIDFLFSILRILEEDEFNKHELIKRFKLNEDIKAYVKNAQTAMNPILKRDLEYSCTKFSRGLFAITFFAEDKGIDDIPEMLDGLNGMSGKDFIQLIIENLELDIPPDTSDKDLEKIFEEQIKDEIQNFDNVKIYLDYYKYPDAMKERLVKTLYDYYYEFFKPVEEEIKSFIHKKLELHQRLIHDDYDKFFENMVLMIDKEQIKNKKIEFYITYFSELGSSLRYTDDTYTVLYGYGLEQRFDENMKRMEYKELIKIMSDDNRFKIIKVLGERAWYGKELAVHFGITTATMSYHLKKISGLGIIDIETGKNKRFYYRLNKDKFTKIVNNMVYDVVNE